MAFIAFCILVSIATLNREVTGVVLVLSWWCVYPRQWQRGTLITLCFVATYALLWAFIPTTNPIDTYTAAWQQRQVDFRIINFYTWALIMSPLIITIGLRLLSAPATVKRLSLVLIPYSILLLGFSIPQEIRLFMPYWLVAIIAVSAETNREINSQGA